MSNFCQIFSYVGEDRQHESHRSFKKILLSHAQPNRQLTLSTLPPSFFCMYQIMLNYTYLIMFLVSPQIYIWRESNSVIFTNSMFVAIRYCKKKKKIKVI